MAEMTAVEHAIQVLKSSIQYNNDADPDDCRLALSVIEQQAQEIAQLNAQLQEQEKFVQVQAQEIERLRDLHRSILWLVEEHKKIPNCKKWMPLIEEKARQGIEKEAEVQTDENILD